MRKVIYALMVAFMISGCSAKAPRLGKDSLDKVIGAMTLEEKAHIVIGTGMDGFESGDSAVVGETRSIVPGAAGTTYPIPRLGIPAIVLADGPAGLRINPVREGDTSTYYCTHFPVGTLLSSTWDTALVEKVGQAIGNEVLEYGVDVLLAPALNIQRNPLCGRNFEYYSEDPLLSGKMAAAYVRGVQSNGVGTSVKHFAVNNQETNRMANDALVSPRALREIYLKGFEIAVKEGRPWTVMSSYNYVNGVYASENKELLTSLLRDEWGFDGMVMTDWFGGSDAVAQMTAGNDMLQPGYEKQFRDIVDGVKSGDLDISVLDRNVRRVLELILRSPRFKGYRHSDKPDLAGHAELARKAAAEGMVLLKNENDALPLSSGVRKVALFGCASYDYIAGGTGSGNVNRAYTRSLIDGLKSAGYVIDDKLASDYETHIKAEKERLKPEEGKYSAFMPDVLPEEMLISRGRLDELADDYDIALLTIGRSSGEFRDRASSSFDLSDNLKTLIGDVCRAFQSAGKRVVVVLNIGGAIETASWKSLPDAVLCAWQSGQEGGNSVVDALTGKVNPSGKLPMTFPVRYQDHASTKNFPVDLESDPDIVASNRGEKKYDLKDVDYTKYEEDIFVGYRYFDSFGKDVSYPFGFGLSYTSFEYGDAAATVEGDIIKVSADVTNAGAVPGREVVQLYVSAPDALKDDKPEQELKAFAKTRELGPGETARVTLEVNISDLASYDEGSSSWIVKAGTYKLKIGASSRDVRRSLDVDVHSFSKKTSDLFHLSVPLDALTRNGQCENGATD